MKMFKFNRQDLQVALMSCIGTIIGISTAIMLFKDYMSNVSNR